MPAKLVCVFCGQELKERVCKRCKSYKGVKEVALTLKEIIKIANDAYPDNLIQQYFDEPNKSHGDSMAEFIANELKETFDDAKDYTEKGQLENALGRILTAHCEMQRVIDAYQDAINRIPSLKVAIGEALVDKGDQP